MTLNEFNYILTTPTNDGDLFIDNPVNSVLRVRSMYFDVISEQDMVNYNDESSMKHQIIF